MSGIINIDVYHSTRLHEVRPRNGITQDMITATFENYNSLLDKTFQDLGGSCWLRIGDGRIFLFPTPEDAVQASIRLLDNLARFNEEQNQLNLPIFVRIGVHEIDKKEEKVIKDVPHKKRSEYGHTALDIAGKLQKNCPLGKIALSTGIYHRLRQLWHGLFRPSLTTLDGLRGRNFFVSINRNIMPQEEKLFFGLPQKQMVLIPPVPYPIWEEIVPDQNVNLTKLADFFNGKVLVVLGETGKHPESPVASAATSDAVGIMEVMAVIKSNPEVRVGIAEWEDTADLVSDRNILLVGSSIVNIYAYALNDLLFPVHFAKAEGQVFDLIIATSKEGTEYFGPHGIPPRDSAIVITSRSPFNREKALLWVAGITGMGTQAATRLVWDLVRDPVILSQKIEARLDNPIACVVAPYIPEGLWEISDYYKRWRILDYKILWAVDKDGNSICPCKN